MDTITVTGMVLSAMPVGETDRRVTLLTKEQGCVSAFARGASRPQSPLLASTRPFATGEFTLYPRRDSYSLQDASIREYFDSIVKDYDKMAYGCYFMELAGYFAAESADGTQLLNLLYLTLRAVQKGAMPIELIRLVFEYRVFAVGGVYPQVFECGRCRKKLTEGYFSMAARQAFCPACRREGEGEYLSPSAVYTLQYILTAPLTKLYSFQITKDIFLPLSNLLERWKKRYLDRDFKSLALIGIQNPQDLGPTS